MPKSETSLKDLLYDIRRIEEHREKLSEDKIKAMYRTLMKDLRNFLAEGYEKYSDKDGRFFISYLDAQNKRAKFLEEMIENVNSISPQLRKEILDLVEATYINCYEGMVEALQIAEENGKLAVVTQDLSVRPEVLQQAVNNNISKLTLPAVLEKHRQDIIYQLQRELTTGLMNGDRYDQMAKRISERVDISYGKALNIVRTESHRNTESGFMDCAENIAEGLEGSGLIYVAIWRTMKDERVRPQRRYKTKKGWKTVLSTNGANHMKMHGVTIKVGDKFQLEPNVYARCPSESGYARHDCNCRCTIEYDLMTPEELQKATGKAVEIASLHKSTRQLMNENGIADCELVRTTNGERFSNAIESAKRANKHGGSVDPVSPEQAAKYKCFIASNDMAGVAVKPDGDITAVFKNSNWKQKGTVNDLIITARANGGVKMDCYGVGLVNMYEKCGYVPVARVAFNADYVSDPFLLETRPDVYVLMKNTDSIETVIQKNAAKAYKLSSQADVDNLPTFEYDDALAYRDKLLEGQK